MAATVRMAATAIRHGLPMRRVFDVSHLAVPQWFPGHMGKGLGEMQRKLKAVDCIIEVHDARVPFSGRNAMFESRLNAIKPHILIINKVDLIEPKYINIIREYYNDKGVANVMFTNCKREDSKGIKSLIPLVNKVIEGSVRYNRSEEASYQLMIIGIPNVGKSSLINALRGKHLRRSKASAVGGLPGITRSVLTKIKVCDSPKVYLLDTPGILSPRIADVETGLKLALAATIKDHLVGEVTMADYLLYILNCRGNHSYVSYLGLDEPTDDIQKALTLTAVRNNWSRKHKSPNGMQVIPNTLVSANYFIKGFRKGKFGPIVLDELPVSSS